MKISLKNRVPKLVLKIIIGGSLNLPLDLEFSNKGKFLVGINSMTGRLDPFILEELEFTQ